VTFSVAGAHSHGRWTSGHVGHYHTNERQGFGKRGEPAQAPDCWEQVNDAIQLIHECGPNLEAIPVADAPRRKPKAAPRSRSPKNARALRELEISHRAANALAAIGVHTVEDAAEKTEFELLSLDGVGDTTIIRLKGGLEAKGLQLREGPTPQEVGSDSASTGGAWALPRRTREPSRSPRARQAQSPAKRVHLPKRHCRLGGGKANSTGTGA
jgi:hypothetical protein